MRYNNQKMEKLWCKARQKTWWNGTLTSSCLATKLLHILFLRCSVSAGAEAKVQIVLCSVTTWIHFLTAGEKVNSGLLYMYLCLRVYLFNSLKLSKFSRFTLPCQSVSNQNTHLISCIYQNTVRSPNQCSLPSDEQQQLWRVHRAWASPLDPSTDKGGEHEFPLLSSWERESHFVLRE